MADEETKDEGFSERIQFCEHCKTSITQIMHVKFTCCQHSICVTCYMKNYLYVFAEVPPKCHTCQLEAILDSLNPDEECPLCFVDYAASRTSPREHWERDHAEIDDEGISDIHQGHVESN